MFQHRLLQRSFLPGFAAIGGHFDGLDQSAAGPGYSGNFVKAGAGKMMSAGRARDDRFGFHHDAELTGFAAGQQVGVESSFVACHGGLVDEFEAMQPLHVDVPFPSREG